MRSHRAKHWRYVGLIAIAMLLWIIHAPTMVKADTPDTGATTVPQPLGTPNPALPWNSAAGGTPTSTPSNTPTATNTTTPSNTPTTTNTTTPSNTPTTTNTTTPSNTPTTTNTPTPTGTPDPGFCVNANVTIPDANPAGVSSTLNVAQTGTIGDLNVLVDITHTWVGDLVITLEHNAVTAEILDRVGVLEPTPGVGCSGDNLNNTADDQAATEFETSCTSGPNPTAAYPIGQSYIPGDPAGPNLATFNGQDTSGAWVLTVSDNEVADTGTLNIWCLIPTTATPLPTPTVTAIVTTTPIPTPDYLLYLPLTRK